MKAEQSAAAEQNLLEVKRLPWTELLKRVGPGMVLTGVVVGPGSITTAAVLGARFEYQLFWLIIPVFVMSTAFLMVNYRIAMLTGMPILQAINHYYGRAAAAIVGTATFISGVSFTVSNFTGTGMGVSLILPVSWQVGSILMTAVCLLFVFWRGGAYSILEKVISTCVVVMLVCFAIAFFATGGPKWPALLKGLVVPGFPSSAAIPAALAFVSTSATVTTGMYGTYLGREKKWKKEDLLNGAVATDAMAHVLSVCVISLLIMSTGAIVLNPQGIVIQSPAELAELLAPVLGGAARYVMGFSIVGAAFSSLLGTSQRTAVLMLDGLGLPCGLDQKVTRFFCTGVLVFAAVMALTLGSSPVQLVLAAQICTAVATPVAGIFMILLMLRKDVGAELKRPWLLIAAMIVSYLIALGLTANTVINMIVG